MNRVNCIKNSTSIRKLAYIFIIICFLPLTACMSKEEREKAEKNEALARPNVQEYLNLNYGSGKIKSLNCLNSSKGGSLFPDFKDYASPYVKSSVIVDKQEFSVITNTKTGQCYDNYNELLIKEALKNHVASYSTLENCFLNNANSLILMGCSSFVLTSLANRLYILIIGLC